MGSICGVRPTATASPNTSALFQSSASKRVTLQPASCELHAVHFLLKEQPLLLLGLSVELGKVARDINDGHWQRSRAFIGGSFHNSPQHRSHLGNAVEMTLLRWVKLGCSAYV